MWTEAERKMKVLARRGFIQSAPGMAKHYLTLPGEDCMDIREALEYSKVGKKTKITAVERDPETHAKILGWFALNKNRFRSHKVHLGELHNTEIDPMDFAFLDYLGNLTAPDASWIKDTVGPALMDNSYLGLTVAVNSRSNKFIPTVRKYLHQNHAKYYKEISRQVRRFTGINDVQILECMTTYTIMLRQYLLVDFNYSLQMNQYGEKSSTYVMTLFRLLNVQQEKYHQDKEQRRIRKGIQEIVDETSARGIRVVSSNLPITRSTTVAKKERIDSGEVIEQLRKAKTPGKKAAATKKLNLLMLQGKREGKDPKMVRAGVLARLSRIRNGNC